jgi:hypothetical protein
MVSNGYESRIDSINRHANDPPPPPPAPFYMYYHFIVDSTGKMYYYQLNKRGWFCGTDYDFKVPEYIGIRPNDIVEIPENSVQDFIKSNILNQDPAYQVICVGLLKDTVSSNGLAKLRDLVQTDTSTARWFIRQATMEESVVLDFKKKQKRYYPEDIEWDSTRIRFVAASTNFTPPKVKED